VVCVGAHFPDVCCAGASKRSIWSSECCDGVGEAEGLSECVWQCERVVYSQERVVVSFSGLGLGDIESGANNGQVGVAPTVQTDLFYARYISR
jgi:hypothetical protein